MQRTSTAQIIATTWLITLFGLAVYGYWFAPAGSEVAKIIQNSVYVLAPITAVIAASFATSQFGAHTLQGKVLYCITLGLLAWCIGEIIWVYFDVFTDVSPYPSLADLYYLVAYIPLAAGLILELRFMEVHWQKLDRPLLFALGLVGLLSGIIVAYTGVYLAYQPDVSWLTNLIGISYGLGDLVLLLLCLLVVALVWEMRGGKLSQPWLIFFVGMTITLIADIIFAQHNVQYDAEIGWYKPSLDTLWIIAYILYAYAWFKFTWLIQGAQSLVRKQSWS